MASHLRKIATTRGYIPADTVAVMRGRRPITDDAVPITGVADISLYFTCNLASSYRLMGGVGFSASIMRHHFCYYDWAFRPIGVTVLSITIEAITMLCGSFCWR